MHLGGAALQPGSRSASRCSSRVLLNAEGRRRRAAPAVAIARVGCGEVAVSENKDRTSCGEVTLPSSATDR